MPIPLSGGTRVSLQEEIESRAREIKTDGYSMSIGELLNIYLDGDIDIHPEFQRIFRWTLEQKSRLIESVFLGIPIPPIFVAQRQDGVWDVVDGVQRLSTILEFTGRLKEPDGRESPELLATEYLPSLRGKRWGENNDEGDAERFLTDEQRRYFKRSKIDFIIVKKESDPNAKYDLFQRLNSGTHLGEQEARNCLAVMLDSTFYRWLLDLAAYPHYSSCIAISERREQESYGVENVLRYLASLLTPPADLEKMGDVGDFLTRKMREFVSRDDFNREAEGKRFKRTFDVLFATLGEDTFRRYDSARGKHSGAFSISAYETVAVGVAANIERWLPAELSTEARDELTARIRSVWQHPVFMERAGGGKVANRRIPYLVALGKQIFA
jgi:hypothetical protein